MRSLTVKKAGRMLACLECWSDGLVLPSLWGTPMWRGGGGGVGLGVGVKKRKQSAKSDMGLNRQDVGLSYSQVTWSLPSFCGG